MADVELEVEAEGKQARELTQRSRSTPGARRAYVRALDVCTYMYGGDACCMHYSHSTPVCALT